MVEPGKLRYQVGLKVIKVKVGLAEGTLQGLKRAWSEASFGMEACFPLQGGGSAITLQSKPWGLSHPHATMSRWSIERVLQSLC